MKTYKRALTSCDCVLTRRAPTPSSQYGKGSPALHQTTGPVSTYRALDSSVFLGTDRRHGLGKTLEVGAGPYTQTKAILEFTKMQVESITLAEPNIYRYVSLDNCAYKDGTLLGHPTILVSAKVEDLGFVETFDTVIHMNVLEHVSDAFEYLTKMYMALKPGGMLIFHERWHTDVEAGVLGDPQGQGFQLHPVRVRITVLDHLLSLFDPLYNTTEPTTLMRHRSMGEEAYYFVGIKKTAACKLQWGLGGN